MIDDPLRVLVIEDEPELSLILRDNLEAEGYNVLSAHTAESGLQLADQHHPEAVLLDVMLPDVSGLDVCRRLRAESPTTLVAMMSARNSDATRQEGFASGADEYFNKPFEIGRMLQWLREKLLAVRDRQSP